MNRSESEFGTGWWFAGLDQLVVSGSGALLVSSSGDTTWYADDGSGGYLPAEGDRRFATLVENGGGDFTLTAKTGETWIFSTTGLLTSFDYTSGRFTTVTQPDPDGAGPLDSSTSTYGYDAAGHKISEGQPSLGPSTQILYDYDDAGRLWRRCRTTRRISWDAIRCARSRMSTMTRAS